MPGQRGPRKKAQHGGYRKPSNPAPVSGPGAASRRTDGGPADRQPVRAIPSGGPGATYGDRQASVDLQSAAPLAAASPAATPTPQTAGVPNGAMPDPFGPTQRPGEPLTAGAMLGPGRTPGPAENTVELLRGLYQQFPYEGVRDLIEELGG